VKQIMNPSDQAHYEERQKKHLAQGRLYELKLFSKHVDMLEQLDRVVDRPAEGGCKVLWQDYKAGSDVLCVGCRYGIEMLAMREMGFSPARLIGIDLFPRSGEVRRADMHALPLSDRSFDIVYSHHSLDHALNPRIALAELARVSRPDAAWVFTVPFRDHGPEESVDFDSDGEIERLLLEAKGPSARTLYSLTVERGEDGFVRPADTWLPRHWMRELRIIIQ
jgi:SAM-dependent methyltransferase